MPLHDYIEKYHGGNNSDFARMMGVRRDVVGNWIADGWIIIAGILYSPRRAIPENGA